MQAFAPAAARGGEAGAAPWVRHPPGSGRPSGQVELARPTPATKAFHSSR